jgi:hypothetical protein
MKKFCLTAIYKGVKPTEIYIDRVENNDLCLLNGKLSDYEKGTVKLIKVALFVMKSLFPDVTKYTLHDDSQLYCDKSSFLFKLSMSYDYILKYNETWYQKNFNAELPESLMTMYNNSLKVLDEPITDYALIVNMFPQFSEYKSEYESSSTPRKFISLLRKKLDREFCFKVGKWLNQYMVSLQIKLLAENWYINAANIKNVPNFSMTHMDSNNANRILNGGGRTRKNNKRIGYKIKSDSAFTENCVGYYDE